MMKKYSKEKLTTDRSERNRFGNKNRPVQINRYSRWKTIVIFLSLIFLGISALPNLYQNQPTLVVSEYTDAASLLEAGFLKHKLTENGFEVDSIERDQRESRIVLQSDQHIGDAQGYLNQLLNPIIDVSSESNGQLAESEGKIVDGYKTKKLTKNYRVDIQDLDTRPEWLQSIGIEPIKLGLDLSGGVLFVLDVDLEKAFKERLQDIRLSAKSLLRENKIAGVKVSFIKNSKILLAAKSDHLGRSLLSKVIAELSKQFPQLSAQYPKNNQVLLSYSEADLQLFQRQIMHQTLSTMRGRIEELGITEAVVQRQGAHRIRIELPGASDPEDVRPIIGATAALNFYQLQSRGGKTLLRENGERLMIDPRPIFSGKHIQDAQAGRDELGQPLVNLTLDNLGGDKMLKFSSKNIGKPMVTVFSEYYKSKDGETNKKNKVISVATIQTQLGSRFSITNLGSPQQAQELALLLRAGSLTAPVTISKQRTIAATLGDSNISNGLAALMLGVGVTLLFMVAWYRRLGLIANSALILNLISLLGLMSLLPGVVLTLPGIAGLVLTVGMAVDTNVLIFERIKQEKRRGLSHSLAIEQGYKNAFATIFDANVTTLITAAILYSIGYGPIKGFAITLGLGILTSMFTGVFISKTLTNLFYTKHNKVKKLNGNRAKDSVNRLNRRQNVQPKDELEVPHDKTKNSGATL
jgi:preprotein translocase subunit SecD